MPTDPPIATLAEFKASIIKDGIDVAASTHLMDRIPFVFNDNSSTEPTISTGARSPRIGFSTISRLSGRGPKRSLPWPERALLEEREIKIRLYRDYEALRSYHMNGLETLVATVMAS
jgi:hypothetical protein